MKYRGKYNLKENLFRGRGMGLLTEVTGDGGRAYEAAVAAHCKGSTNFKGSSLESGGIVTGKQVFFEIIFSTIFHFHFS